MRRLGPLELRVEAACGAARRTGTRSGTACRSGPRRRRAAACRRLRQPPTMTRSSMSTTSSVRRRPFGKPWVSPAERRRSGSGARFGATPRLIFSVSVGGAPGAIWVRPGNAGEQRLHDVRAVVLGHLTPGNRALMTFASSGESTYLPKFFRSSDGWVALNWSFWPDRDDHLVDQRVAEAADLALTVSSEPAARARTREVARWPPGSAGDLHTGGRRGPHADDRVGAPWRRPASCRRA